ncbi:MAG: translation initiation factor IF-2 [Pseudomonadota bacterium]
MSDQPQSPRSPRSRGTLSISRSPSRTGPASRSDLTRQTFSHGRTNIVQVERKRSRSDRPASSLGEDLVSGSAGLTLAEQEKRQRLVKALQESQTEPDAPVTPEPPQAEPSAPQTEVGPTPAEIAAAQVRELVRIPTPEPADPARPTRAAEPKKDVRKDAEHKDPAHDGKEQDAPSKRRVTRQPRERRAGRITVSQVLSGYNERERTRSLASLHRSRNRQKKAAPLSPAEKIFRDVTIPESITARELANRMSEQVGEVTKCLMKLGVMVTVNDVIDGDTAEIVVQEMGHRPHRVAESDIETGLSQDKGDAQDIRPRPPVVTVMGHVDHGKTSLLDALRKTNVANREAGGITQHIGAYCVNTDQGEPITIMDTPGHEAFTAMRARGASVTDIVVLVVAADDGVMPQTIEAMNHAKAAKVPMIVAINKTDLPEAKPERVLQDLLNHEVVVESLGGTVPAVQVSAKRGDGLDDLLEVIQLQAGIGELTANYAGPARGKVIEARLEKGRGPVMSLLVIAGVLQKGDVFVVGAQDGRVRAMRDDLNQDLDEAGPSRPVEVIGLNGVPEAGDDFIVVDSEARAREVADYRARKKRLASQATTTQKVSLDQMLESAAAQEIKEIPIIVKADVQGSVEAIIATLHKSIEKFDDIKIRTLHSAVGGINESDVSLAASNDGVIIGFNVRANPQARQVAKRDGVVITYHSVIYELAEAFDGVISKARGPQTHDEITGMAEILEVFDIGKLGNIAGCKVIEGSVQADSLLRVLRDDTVIHEGKISSLRRFKNDTNEVREGDECGIGIEKFHNLQKGDILEVFKREKVLD